MKKAPILPGLICLSMLLSVVSAAAQSDSIRPVTNKRVAALIAKVAQDSGKLIRYKGMVPELELQRKNADSAAQLSADDNKRAADRLVEDPQSKKLSRRAKSAARIARNDSQKARTAANKLDRLHKDINKASQKLQKDQEKLERYRVGRNSMATRQ